jgi:hypothetical protein
MVIDERLLAAARGAEERMIEAERAADMARAEFRYAVRKLHLAGGSLREIGERLDLSHQRVHQIVAEAGGGRGWRGFATRTAGSRSQRPNCSFCGKAQKEVKTLIAGPGGVAICDGCAATASQVLATGKSGATPLSAVKPVPADKDTVKCDFCGKRREQVDGLVLAAGTTTAGVAICDECLALCHEIVSESTA